MNDVMQMDNFWITITEYVLLIAVCAASVVITAFALYLLRRLKRERNFEAAPSLIVYLVSLCICCFFLTLQYALLTLYTLMPPPLASFAAEHLPRFLSSSTQFIFWTGLLPGSLIPAVPVSVLFLSLDRLAIILHPYAYASRPWLKQVLAALSMCSMVALFAVSAAINVAQRPVVELPECISFGCLTSGASRLIYAINRLAVALPNFVAGTAFLVALYTFRRRIERQSQSKQPVPATNTRSQKMGDRLTFYVVLFEFLFDLLPNTGNLLLTSFFNINISVYVGAFRSMTFAACVFSAVLSHTTILWRIFSSKTFKNSVGAAAALAAQTRTKKTQNERKQSAGMMAMMIMPVARPTMPARTMSWCEHKNGMTQVGGQNAKNGQNGKAAREGTA